MSIGTTRNLTVQFVRLRNEAKRLRPDLQHSEPNAQTARLLGEALGGNSSDIEMGPTSHNSSTAPSWVQKSERIRSEMGVVKDRLVKLREYHQKALLVTFDSSTDSSSHTEALTREIQSSFKRLQGEISAMDKGGQKGKDEDEAVRAQVQKQLAQALFKLSVEFRKEETRFLNKVEQQKGLEAGSSIGIIEDDSRAVENVDPGFTQDQLAKVDFHLDVIQERDNEIRQIVETIAELAQIMRDLSTLVVEQGTILDRIDYNIVQTKEKVETGVKELVKAEASQKNSRMLLCISCLVIAIVVMLIIVIVRHAGGRRPAAPVVVYPPYQPYSPEPNSVLPPMPPQP